MCLLLTIQWFFLIDYCVILSYEVYVWVGNIFSKWKITATLPAGQDPTLVDVNILPSAFLTTNGQFIAQLTDVWLSKSMLIMYFSCSYLLTFWNFALHVHFKLLCVKSFFFFKKSIYLGKMLCEDKKKVCECMCVCMHTFAHTV